MPDPSPSPTTPIPTQTTPPINPALVPELLARQAWRQGVLGAVNLFALVLAVRLTLMLSVLGAVALAWLAAEQQNPYRLAALGIYTVSVVLPLVALAGRR